MTVRFPILTFYLITLLITSPTTWAEEVSDLNEREFNTLLSELKGNVIILQCFTLWFPECKQQALDSVLLTKHYNNQKVKFLGLCVDNTDLSHLKKFAKEHHINYPIYLGSKKILKPYDVHSFPTSFVLDANGDTFKTYRGYVSTDALKATINDILKET